MTFPCNCNADAKFQKRRSFIAYLRAIFQAIYDRDYVKKRLKYNLLLGDNLNILP